MSVRHSPRDEGAGSILVITLMSLVALLGAAVMAILIGVARHARVQAAADTSAEAAIAASLAGIGDPCGVAARGVEAQGLRQLRCTLVGTEVEVVVDDPHAAALLQRPALARAGAVVTDAGVPDAG